jgi:hypothetical protein
MWYTGNLLLKAVHVNRPEPEPVWEERIILLEAQNEAEAKSLAERLGRDAEHEYYVSRAENDLLRWTFVKVQKLFPVEDFSPRSGTELFSRFLRQREVESLLTPFEDSETRGE